MRRQGTVTGDSDRERPKLDLPEYTTVVLPEQEAEPTMRPKPHGVKAGDGGQSQGTGDGDGKATEDGEATAAGEGTRAPTDDGNGGDD